MELLKKTKCKVVCKAPVARAWSSEQLPFHRLAKRACDDGDSKAYFVLTLFVAWFRSILLANDTSYELSQELDYPTQKPGSPFPVKRATARHNLTLRRVQYRDNIRFCAYDQILNHGRPWKSYGGHRLWLETNKLCFALVTIPIAATRP